MKSLLAIALVVVGCGDDGASTIDAAATPDSPADSPSQDASVDAPPAAREGQVFLGEVHGTLTASTAVAMFLNGPLFETLGSADHCEAIDGGPATSLSAGSIALTGTTTDLTLAQESADDPYTPTTETPEDLFAPGATLSVTATGGVVPAFTGDVIAPQPLEDVVFPDTLSRSAPATITWTAGAGDTMWFLVVSTSATPGAMLCRVPDDGSFTLTTAAIGLLPAAATQVSVVAYRLQEVSVAAGAWTVYLRAGDSVTSAITPIGS